MSASAKELLSLYRTMLRIRRLEERVESLYALDEMKTPIHLCIGQEAVAAGVCARLAHDDYVSSTHRGHGHYLAKGGDLNALVAELYCRETGCSKGRGGSMHLVDTSVHFPVSSSIVGGGIPIATGIGLALSLRKSDAISVVFFGDGAADEGVLYESINFAVLKKLPVVFVLENNQFSVCSRSAARQATDNVFHFLPHAALASEKIDGNDCVAVYEAAGRAVTRARKGAGPSFIECLTYRLRGHAGSGSDAGLGYRTQEEIDSWEKKCPVVRLRAHLYESGTLTQKDELLLEQKIGGEIDEAFALAQSAALPLAQDLGRYLYSE